MGNFGVFILVATGAKIIKIDQEIEELYSKIKWHLFPGHGVYVHPPIVVLEVTSELVTRRTRHM